MQKSLPLLPATLGLNPWTEKQNDKIPEFNFGPWTRFKSVEKAVFADNREGVKRILDLNSKHVRRKFTTVDKIRDR